MSGSTRYNLKLQLSPTNSPTSFIAITLIELPSAVVLIILMDIWGRKPLMVNCKNLRQICFLAFGNLKFSQFEKVASLVLPGASCIAAGVLEEVYSD